MGETVGMAAAFWAAFVTVLVVGAFIGAGQRDLEKFRTWRARRSR